MKIDSSIDPLVSSIIYIKVRVELVNIYSPCMNKIAFPLSDMQQRPEKSTVLEMQLIKRTNFMQRIWSFDFAKTDRVYLLWIASDTQYHTICDVFSQILTFWASWSAILNHHLHTTLVTVKWMTWQRQVIETTEYSWHLVFFLHVRSGCIQFIYILKWQAFHLP